MTRPWLPLAAVALLGTPDLARAADPVEKPLFSRHGSVKGQNGFRLSLLGASPSQDHAWLLREFGGRRVNPFEPEKSLLLEKATGVVSHVGGQRMAAGGRDYRLLRNWLTQGAKPDKIEDSRVTALRVSPPQQTLRLGQTYALKIEAAFADGTKEDVTDLCRFEVLDQTVAAVDASGTVTAKSVGDTAVIVRYGYEPVVARLVVPRVGNEPFPDVKPNNFIDQAVLAKYWLTGSPRKTGVTPAYPVYGNVAAKLRPAPRDVPTFVAFGDIDNHAYGLKQNYLGPTADPIVLQPDDARSEVGGMLVPPAGPDLSAFDRREGLRQSLDTQLRGLDDPLVGGMDKFQQTAFDLLRSPKLRDALDITKEPLKVAERYGKNSHGRRVLAARRLVEAGVPFVYTHFESDWDDHGQNSKACRSKLPVLDNAVASLIEDLHNTGLLEKTIVMVLGEMGRTPKINKDAGRDHWGTCQSVLVAGGGFKGGPVVGATDKHAAYVTDKDYKVESFGRTIYHLLGIDPDQTLDALDNRPHRLIGEDTPLIKEALA